MSSAAPTSVFPPGLETVASILCWGFFACTPHFGESCVAASIISIISESVSTTSLKETPVQSPAANSLPAIPWGVCVCVCVGATLQCMVTVAFSTALAGLQFAPKCNRTLKCRGRWSQRQGRLSTMSWKPPRC